MEALNYEIVSLSEKAVVVQFESSISQENLMRVLSLQSSLNQNSFDGFIESVPSYSSLTVYFDPWIVAHSSLNGESSFDIVSGYLKTLSIDSIVPVKGRTHLIPVCYDLKYGLDLLCLVDTLKLSVDEIVSIHSSLEYTVYLIGFTPGFPYMGILPSSLECERKENPRKRITPGSVGIAGRQTGIYPFETPGGWQIIGITPLTLFSINEAQPSLLKPGDKVKFEPISLKEFQSLKS